MTPRYTFGDLRKINHLTINQLSEQTGISADTLSNIEIRGIKHEWTELAILQNCTG